MRRIPELDALRGLAALLVVIHHDFFVSRVIDGASIRYTPLRGLEAGRPFVLLFFVLSGFVLSRAIGERSIDLRWYVTWVVQRAVRLLLPALGSVLLGAVLYHMCADPRWSVGGNPWFSANWNAPPTLPAAALQGVLVARPDLNVVLWSLAVEWRLSFLIPLMVLVARSSRNGSLVVVGVGLALTGLAGGSVPTGIYAGDSLFSTIRSALYFVLPFALGVGLDRSGACTVATDRRVAIAALLACVGLAQVDQDIATFLWATMVIWTAQLPSPVRDALRWPPSLWLGKVSFSLYLIHVPVMLSLFHLLHDRMSPVMIASMAVASSLVVAWLFHLAVEGPSHRLARMLQMPAVAMERERTA